MASLALGRDYFGEKVAFYFGFLGMYTMALGLLSIVSCIFYAYCKYRETDDNAMMAVYAIFVCLWAFGFMVVWVRKETVI